MGFELKENEIEVLRAIDENKVIDFFTLCEKVGIETNKMVPVVWRLEEEEYVASKGIIYRKIFLTEKGVATLTKKS